MSRFDLTGKIALVTGAAEGIGYGCALELARAGADIVINDRPGSEELLNAAEKVRETGRECWAVEANVFEREGCEFLLNTAVEHAGHIDILVSNPAFSRRQPFLEYEPDVFEKTIQGTLMSGFHMGQLVSRHFVEQSIAGKLIFVSSVQSLMPYADSVAYNAAKAGLDHMVETMAVELAEYRINANTIQPGWTETPGEHRAFGTDVIESEGAKLPWGRLGTPEDIGLAATYLASEAADYVTGTSLKVDGGFVFKDC